MCDFVGKFLSNLEPIIINIKEQKEELDRVRKELDEVVDFLKYIGNDLTKISTYSNQDFIYKNLPSIESDENNYRAMVYLVNSDNLNIKSLPQYENAVKYMNSIVEYLDNNRENLIKLENEISEEYEYKVIAKKYYDLFQKEGSCVEDYNELVNFLLTLDLTEKEKQDMLCYTIKTNVAYYQNNNEELEVDREQDLVKIHEIIHENKNLMSNEYMNFLDKVSKKINVNLNIKDLIKEEIIEKISVDNIILAKKIWLTNKISQNYKSCEFGRVSKYIKEYDELMILKEKIENINDKDKIIRIVKGGY